MQRRTLTTRRILRSDVAIRSISALVRSSAAFARNSAARAAVLRQPGLRKEATRTFSNIFTTETSPAIFYKESRDVLMLIQDRLEADDMDGKGLDIETQDGVVKVAVPGKGTWVINTHNVTRQIWLSSPVSGPNKYNYHADRHLWLGERDQHSLHDKLQREFSALTGIQLTFSRKF